MGSILVAESGKMEKERAKSAIRTARREVKERFSRRGDDLYFLSLGEIKSINDNTVNIGIKEFPQEVVDLNLGSKINEDGTIREKIEWVVSEAGFLIEPNHYNGHKLTLYSGSNNIEEYCADLIIKDGQLETIKNMKGSELVIFLNLKKPTKPAAIFNEKGYSLKFVGDETKELESPFDIEKDIGSGKALPSKAGVGDEKEPEVQVQEITQEPRKEEPGKTMVGVEEVAGIDMENILEKSYVQEILEMGDRTFTTFLYRKIVPVDKEDKIRTGDLVEYLITTKGSKVTEERRLRALGGLGACVEGENLDSISNKLNSKYGTDFIPGIKSKIAKMGQRRRRGRGPGKELADTVSETSLEDDALSSPEMDEYLNTSFKPNDLKWEFGICDKKVSNASSQGYLTREKDGTYKLASVINWLSGAKRIKERIGYIKKILEKSPISSEDLTGSDSIEKLQNYIKSVEAGYTRDSVTSGKSHEIDINELELDNGYLSEFKKIVGADLTEKGAVKGLLNSDASFETKLEISKAVFSEYVGWDEVHTQDQLNDFLLGRASKYGIPSTDLKKN